MTGARDRSRLATALAAALVAVLLGGLVVPVPVAAGDNAAIFYFESREYDVDSGETVALDLLASSHGGYSGAGVGELSVTIAYDPDVFTVTDVEHGSMLAVGGADVDGSVEIDDANGTVTIAQERTSAGDGAKATDTAATLTLAVADDAEPTTETLEIADAQAILVDDSRQGTVERNGTVRVDGGGDSSDSDDGGDEGGGPDGVTLAEEADSDGDVDAEGGNDATEDAEAESRNETDGTTDGEEATGGATDDPVPGFAGPSALVAIAALFLLLGRR